MYGKFFLLSLERLFRVFMTVLYDEFELVTSIVTEAITKYELLQSNSWNAASIHLSIKLLSPCGQIVISAKWDDRPCTLGRKKFRVS